MPSTLNRRCALAFALAYPTLLTWVYFVLLAGAPAANQRVAYGIGKAIQFAFPAAWAWLFSRESIGLPRPTRKGLLAGAVFGLAVGGGMIAVYHSWLKTAAFFTAALEPMVAKLEGFGLLSPTAFIVMGVFYAVAHSALEEYYWRWFVFGQLRQTCALHTAIAVSSLGFTAHHVLIIAWYFGWWSPATWLFSAAVAIGGAFWALLYHRSGSLLGPWLSHLLIDAAILVIGFELVF
jgi:membrane protease YdiL (CAAX protease family)